MQDDGDLSLHPGALHPGPLHLGPLEHQDRAQLRHHLEQDARRHEHPGGVVSLARLLVGAEVLDPNDPPAGFKLRHAIDQQEGMAVGKDAFGQIVEG